MGWQPYLMPVQFVRRLFAKPALTLAAILFGAFVVVADVILFGAFLGRVPDFSDPDVLITKSLLAALPFLLLAYRGSTRLIPWLTGITVALWLWWRWLENGVAYQRAPDGSGVDMAFAFLMLVSPLFIGLACSWVDEVMRQVREARIEAIDRQRLSLLNALAVAPARATRRWKRRAGELWRQF